MRILVACEYSGKVREAFRSLGHDVTSCDLLPSDDNSPNHTIGDCLDVIKLGWDLIIMHPPCTALADPHAQYAEIAGGADANFTTMPQVGGDPIVESGSNADGEWTRWADGTQVVNTTPINTTPDAQDWSGTLYRTAATVTFPVTFIGSPNSFGSIERTGIASALCTSRSTTTSGSAFTVISHTTDVVGVSATAIGRWK